MIKIIDSLHYHIWTDALHARELARQTENEWDRGVYVRWTIQTAWTAFENVCSEALQAKNLGMRFKDVFDEAIEARGLLPVDWSQGIWQQVLQVYGDRKNFVHIVPSSSHATLLAPLEKADEAITILRRAIKAVLEHSGAAYPAWVNDDEDHGWCGPRGVNKAMGAAVAIHAGVSENDPEAIRITYLLGDDEHLCDIAPPETPYTPLLERLVESLNIHVDAVRAYRGKELLEERKLNLR